MKSQKDTIKELQSIDAYAVETDVLINEIWIENVHGLYILHDEPKEQIFEGGSKFEHGVSHEGELVLTVLQAQALVARLQKAIKEHETFNTSVHKYFEEEQRKGR